jgi:hypothetical protein
MSYHRDTNHDRAAASEGQRQMEREGDARSRMLAPRADNGHYSGLMQSHNHFGIPLGVHPQHHNPHHHNHHNRPAGDGTDSNQDRWNAVRELLNERNQQREGQERKGKGRWIKLHKFVDDFNENSLHHPHHHPGHHTPTVSDKLLWRDEDEPSTNMHQTSCSRSRSSGICMRCGGSYVIL